MRTMQTKKLLRRNLREFWYANIESYDHGEPIYGEAIKARGNIGGGTGEAQIEAFGILPTYDKTILPEDYNLPISETSVLWVENDPQDGEPYDYIVVKGGIAKSLNYAAIAVAHVTVS